jgi:hypothetical protein
VSDRLAEVEAKLAELTGSLREVERRLAALEKARAAPARREGAPVRAATATPAAEEPLDTADITRGLSLGGRTLLVLAGAFVLRALTDSGTLPTWLGVGLGFLYAGTWIAMAERAGRSGQTWSAGFHGIAAVAIGFPLLFEASGRFKLLSPWPAAVALTLLTGVALLVASRRRLHGLAWLVSLGGLPTAAALMIASGRMAPAALYLVLLGAATLWLGYVRGWTALRWPVALFADVVLALVAFRAVEPQVAEGPRTALLLLFVLVAAYLGSIATRTLLLDRAVVPFEVVQTALGALVGLGGAVYVASRSGMGSGGFGALAALMGVAGYGVAFTFVARRQKGRENFYFYGAVGLVFALAGTALLLPAGLVGLAWGLFGLAAAAAARRQRSLTLAAHAAIYGVAAGAASGLLSHALRATFESPVLPWPALPFGAVAVVVTLAGAAWLCATAAPRARVLERLPQLALVAALAGAAAGLLIGWLVAPLAGAPGPQASLGVVAAVRTAVLSAGAILLAWAGRRAPWVEAGWLAYPVLATTGLKLLVEDLRAGSPATLVLSFALFGAALILVPRLRARLAAGPEAPAAPPPPPPVAAEEKEKVQA